MKLILKRCILAASLLAPTLFQGCASSGPSGQAAYVDPKGTRTITTVGQVNIQDFAQAAEDAISSLLASGSLDQVQEKPAILVVSRVVNSTGQQLDTDMLTKKIRVALNQSGKALTTTTLGIGGKAEDPLARGLKQENDFLENKKITRQPDFSLSGKIIETRTRAGNLRQSAFTFQLSLTDKRGLAVWEGEKEIVKQGTRPSVGF
jgi:penicillin-binding protein activator